MRLGLTLSSTDTGGSSAAARNYTWQLDYTDPSLNTTSSTAAALAYNAAHGATFSGGTISVINGGYGQALSFSGGNRLLVTHATSPLVVDGRVAVECDMNPKIARASFGADIWCCEFADVGINGWYLRPADGALILYRQGASFVSTAGAATWAIGDSVQLYVEFGGAAPFAKVRVNGAVTAFSFGATPDALGTPTDFDLLTIGAAGPFDSWLKRVRHMKPGRRPGWTA